MKAAVPSWTWVEMLIGCAVLSLLYYRNVVAVFLFIPFGILWVKSREKEIKRQKEKNITEQFVDFLQSIKSSIAAGNNLERAIRRAPRDMAIIWDNAESGMNEEIEKLINMLDNNLPLEECLMTMSNNIGISEVKEFSECIKLCNRNGGNVNEVVNFSTVALQQQLSLDREFELITAEKMVESRILLFMPHVLLLILSFTTGDYILPLYTTWIGRGVMTIALVLIGGAWYAIKKIIV